MKTWDSKAWCPHLPGLCSMLLFFCCGATSSAQMSVDSLRSYIDDANLAIAAYTPSITEVVGGWKRISDPAGSRSDPDGFKAAVFERLLPTGQRDVRIVFAGSDDPNDFALDFRQNIWPLESIGDEIDEQQFVRAQAFAAGFIHQAAGDKTVASIKVVGHSLGGALAQYVSALSSVDATVINSAALRKIEQHLSTEQRNTADRHVTQLFGRLDYVNRPSRWIGGTQHGTHYMLETANWSVKDPHRVEHVRDSLKAAVEDVQKNPSSERFISRRVPVSQEGIELVARNLVVLNTGLQELRNTLEIKARLEAVPQRLNPAVAGTFSGLNKLANALDAGLEIHQLSESIRKDQLEFKDKPMVWLRSATFETLAETALTGTSIPLLNRLPGSDGLLKQFYEVLEANKVIPYQSRVSLSGRDLAIGTPTFGAVAFARAAGSHIGRGYADIDTIENYLEGAVGCTWGILGYVYSGGNLAVAERFEDYGVAMAQTGSFLFKETGADRQTLRVWDSIFRRKEPVNFSNQAQVMSDMYRFHVDRALQAGVRPLSPTEFYGGKGPDQTKIAEETFRSSGYTAKQRQDNEDYYAEKLQSAPSNLKTITLRETPGASTMSSQDARLAAGLAGSGKRAVVFGDGPAAEAAYRQLSQKLGEANVKHVQVAPSSYERNHIASEFGADSVIRITQERYQVSTTAGMRRVERLPLTDEPRKQRIGSYSSAPSAVGDTRDLRRDIVSTVKAPSPRPPEPRKRSEYYAPALPTSFWGPPPPPPPPGALNMDRVTRPTPPMNAPSFPRVGGVMLQGAAQVDSPDSQVAGGNFSLIFQGSDGAVDIPTLRRFVTALWATYFTSKGPGISIDPVGNFTNRHAVRYIGRVINSDLGRVMRETDYMMKCWMVGSSRPDLPDWLSPEEIGIRDGTVHVGAPSRFWFVPENMKFRLAGNALLFDGGAMRVKTEYLGDNKGERNPENEKWAEQFTRRYGEVAQRYPVYEELFEYAKQVSLAKYLKERRVPMLWFLLANREMALTENSQGSVKAFVKKSDYFEGLQGAGGVDLSPGVEQGSFVMDSELLNAIAEARRSAPPRDADNTMSQAPTIEVVEDRNERLAVTPSQTVVISESQSAGDNFATDLGLRLNGNPHLEIARYRRNDFPQVHTFGRDWHLMIPYSVNPASKKRVACGPFSVPEAMVLHNNITGFETIMPFQRELRLGTNSIPVAGYYPDTPEANLNIGLIPMSDMTFRLDDKLGCEFEFDARGRLVRMLLADHLEYATNAAGKVIGVTRAKDYEIAYEYGQKRLNWRSFDILPFRLAPEGTDEVAIGGMRLPRRLRLFDAPTGNEETFNFDQQNLTGLVGYFPADTNRSGYTFLAFKTDGSLVLQHKSGTEIGFDRVGAFRYLILDTLERMVQEPYEVRFEYAVAHGQYRIVTARVFDRKTNVALYAVVYKYARDGSLSGSSVVSAPKKEPSAKKTSSLKPQRNETSLMSHNSNPGT